MSSVGFRLGEIRNNSLMRCCPEACMHLEWLYLVTRRVHAMLFDTGAAPIETGTTPCD
jgi:hypothetical protein